MPTILRAEVRWGVEEYPDDRRYTEEHEWIQVEQGQQGGSQAVVGITDHAQSALGDIVFVELPTVGSELHQGEPFGTVESVKSVSDLYAPASGRVVSINATLHEHPEYVNEDPYGQGWMLRIELAAPAELERLLDARAYERLVSGS